MAEPTARRPVETRWAGRADIPAITALMRLSIDQLQAGFLLPEQIAASHAVMGLDTQLIEDGTYLLAEQDGVAVGCGGWSFRATLFGGDHTVSQRDAAWLDPARDPARIRAMYTHPAFARRGIGRLVLARCEQAATGAGFTAAELMATLSGIPLYRSCGYQPLQQADSVVDGVAVPLMRMCKALLPADDRTFTDP